MLRKLALTERCLSLKGLPLLIRLRFYHFFPFFFLFINFYSASPCLFDGGWTGPLVRTLRTKAQHSNVFLKSVP